MLDKYDYNKLKVYCYNKCCLKISDMESPKCTCSEIKTIVKNETTSLKTKLNIHILALISRSHKIYYFTSSTKMKVKTTDIVAKGTVTGSAASH